MRPPRISWIATLLGVLLLWSATAHAGRRKRVVVLDFEGPKAERFHADLVKLLKRHDTVLSTEKWNGVANDLDAATVTERNVKKVAKKLKIDAVVEGTIVKRRDSYIIRIKLRGGTNGAQVGDQIDTKSNESRLDGNAKRDLQDQLVGAIDALPVNRSDGGDDDGGGDGDGDDTASHDRHHDNDGGDDDTASRDRHHDGDSGDSGDDGDDSGSKRHHGFSRDAGDDMRGGDKVGKHGHDDDDTASRDDNHKKHGKHGHDDGDDVASTSHDDDDNPIGDKDKGRDKGRDRDKDRHASDDQGDGGDGSDSGDNGDNGDNDGGDSDHGDKDHHKRVASSDDGDDDDDTSASAHAGPVLPPSIALSPGQRAIDATAGISFVQRHLAFKYASTLAAEQIPPGYKQTNPVAGATVDVAVFPLAFGHHNKSALAGLGIEAMYDQVLFINSRKLYGMTNNMIATLSTTELRYSVGAVFRHPFGVSATAPIIGGKLTYGQQSFTIQQTLPDMTDTDIPNVKYSTIGLGAFGTYPINPKISLSLDVGYLVVSSTGTSKGYIGNAAEYGKGKQSGEQAQVSGEYRLNDKLFIRADLRVENISMTFPANQTSKANNRDSNNMTQDVFGASDLYFGGMATIGYAY